MGALLPTSLHHVLYRLAHRVRAMMRRTLKFPIHGVGAVLRDGEGRVLMVRHSYGGRGWALPGGGRSRREDPADALRREMREELSLEIEALELIATLEETLSGAPHTSSLFTGIVMGEPMPDGREVIAAEFFARYELPAMLAAPVERRLAIWFAHAGKGHADHNNSS